jgi:hypothetical protein
MSTGDYIPYKVQAGRKKRHRKINDYSYESRRSSKGSKGSKGYSSKYTDDEDGHKCDGKDCGGDRDPWYPKVVPPRHHEQTCSYFKFEFGAFQAPSQETIGTAPDLGAEFIYNSPLFEDEDLTNPVGNDVSPSLFVTGVCTRFQERTELVDGDVIAGAGQCDWTYTISLDGLEGTIEVSGEVFDSVKSTLSITGGTNYFVGAAGQVEIIPSPESTDLDVFTEANYYSMTATVLLQECKDWK